MRDLNNPQLRLDAVLAERPEDARIVQPVARLMEHLGDWDLSVVRGVNRVSDDPYPCGIYCHLAALALEETLSILLPQVPVRHETGWHYGWSNCLLSPMHHSWLRLQSGAVLDIHPEGLDIFSSVNGHSWLYVGPLPARALYQPWSTGEQVRFLDQLRSASEFQRAEAIVQAQLTEALATVIMKPV